VENLADFGRENGLESSAILMQGLCLSVCFDVNITLTQMIFSYANSVDLWVLHDFRKRPCSKFARLISHVVLIDRPAPYTRRSSAAEIRTSAKKFGNDCLGENFRQSGKLRPEQFEQSCSVALKTCQHCNA